METIASKDPQAHTANVRKEFRTLIDHLRGDINKINEPKAQALFETTAEVISGLDTAFKHYEEKSEDDWKEEWRKVKSHIAHTASRSRARPAISN